MGMRRGEVATEARSALHLRHVAFALTISISVANYIRLCYALFSSAKSPSSQRSSKPPAIFISSALVPQLILATTLLQSCEIPRHTDSVPSRTGDETHSHGQG